MKKIVLFILILLIFNACNNNNSQRKALPKLLKTENRGCSSIEAQKFSTLDSLLNYYYSSDAYKDSFELNLWLGTFYYYHGHYDSSMYYYQKSKNIDSSNAYVQYDIALAYCELNRFDDALNSINTTISLCGGNWEHFNSKCYILGELNRCDEAIVAGQISLKLNPENIKIYGNLLRCYDKLAEGDSVIKYVNIVDAKFGKTSDWMKKLKSKYE